MMKIWSADFNPQVFEIRGGLKFALRFKSLPARGNGLSKRGG
jgi:hypothetical protein